MNTFTISGSLHDDIQHRMLDESLSDTCQEAINHISDTATYKRCGKGERVTFTATPQQIQSVINEILIPQMRRYEHEAIYHGWAPDRRNFARWAKELATFISNQGDKQ